MHQHALNPKTPITKNTWLEPMMLLLTALYNRDLYDTSAWILGLHTVLLSMTPGPQPISTSVLEVQPIEWG
jgi:hypothetical protein